MACVLYMYDFVSLWIFLLKPQKSRFGNGQSNPNILDIKKQYGVLLGVITKPLYPFALNILIETSFLIRWSSNGAIDSSLSSP